MASYEDMVRVQQAHEAALFRRSGVHLVGIGHKTVRGKVTDELAIVVMVERKMSRYDLDPADLIPETIEGLPTDVIEGARFEPAFGVTSAQDIDNDEYRPLVGGCAISAYPPLPGAPPGETIFGTLGGFGTTVNQPLPFSYGISCNHVLGNASNQVLQPASGPRVSAVTVAVNDYNMGVDADGFAGLIAGTNYANYILQLGTLTGSRDLTPADINTTTVWKSGATTGATSGLVTAINVSYQLTTGTVFHQILINGQFADHGDSGSFVVVSDQTAPPRGWLVVGLLMAKQSTASGPQAGIANAIENVAQALGVTFPGPPTE